MGQRVVLAGGFLLSAVATALISASPLASTPQNRASLSYPGGPLTAPPSAFTTGRLAPFRDVAGVTRWAPVLRSTVARRAPSFRAAVVGLVPSRTPEGTTNLVVATGELVQRGVMWVRATLSVLPNGTEGWLPRNSLGGWSFVQTHLVIDRARLTATLFRAGRAVFRAPVGIGAPGTPTPAGTFYVRDRLRGFADPFYGPLAFGTNARSPTLTDWPAGGFVGIHGTDQPELIPGRVSHGCIRMKNASISKLGKLMPIGTPVTVR
jgi:L,D-transpeptidase catalytic domain